MMDMIDFIQAWVKSGAKYSESDDGRLSRREPARAICCKDGFTMSVQASSSHDCLPRDESGPYTHFEMCFPSEREDILDQYCLEPDYAFAEYSYVPLEAIVYVIVKHGGIDLERMLQRYTPSYSD